MESVQRRRESQYSMPMGEQLMHAVDLRIAAEEEFKKQIVGQLKALIETLAVCDPTNARTTLDLTQEELRKIIIKLNDNRNISSTEASTIANIVKDSNLLRRPVVSPSPEALPTPPASLTSSVSPVPPLPPVPPPQSTASVAKTGTPLGNIMNPGAETSKGINPNLTPGRRGGRRTRRFRKK